MIGLGTVINAAAIIAGGLLGIFIKNGLPDRLRNTIMQSLGLSVLVIGLSGVLQGIFKVVEGGNISSQYIMLMIISLVLGAFTGEIIDIEQKLDRLGAWFQKKVTKDGEGNFAEGFVNASLLYCVGAMAIVGSLEDGLTGNISTLLAKSLLDGVSAVIFSAAMGIGVIFSAIPVALYQGTITLLAGFIKPFLTDVVISQTSLVGSVLIMGIGFNMLEIKRIKVGNMLPAILVPFIYYIITELIF